MNYTRALYLTLMALVSLPLMGQIVTSRQGVEHKIDVDSIINDFDSRPAFGIYKDTYFVGGTALNHKPTEFNSDVKFQISFRHRLTKSILPLHSHLFLQYSQKAIWNVFEESLPFHDLNFNPGIGIQNLVVYNGEVYFKTWIPIIDGQQNKDILKYCGIFQTGTQFISADRRWVADVTFVKRQGWNLNFNTILNVGFRFSKRDNQYLMLHFYDGYGENLLDYNKYHCRLRIGLLIRPNFFSDF